MALNLAIMLCQRRLVSGYQGFSHADIFQPVPEPKVVIENILATARALCFGRVSQTIVACPDPFWCLHVQLSNSRDKIERKFVMIFPAVHGLVQFGNGRYEFFGRGNLEGGRPMFFHTVEEVDEPLAGDVIAEDNQRHGAGIDHKHGDVVHVGISTQCVSLQCSGRFRLCKTYFSPFCKFPIPSGMIISDRPHITPPTPV